MDMVPIYVIWAVGNDRRPGRLQQANMRLEEAQSAHDTLRAAIQGKYAFRDRKIGYIELSPPIETNVPFTLDVALIKITNKAFVPPANVLYLGDEAEPSDFHSRFHPNVQAQTAFQWPQDAMLPVRGMMSVKSLREAPPADTGGGTLLMVVKRGSASGLTLGRANGIWSKTRRIGIGGDRVSNEWCILGERDRKDAFSEGGDSGAVVLNGRGQVGGLLTAGSKGITGVDCSYATPFAWLIEQLEAAAKQPFALL